MSLHAESWLHMSHAIQLPDRSGAARELQPRAGQGAQAHAGDEPLSEREPKAPVLLLLPVT